MASNPQFDFLRNALGLPEEAFSQEESDKRNAAVYHDQPEPSNNPRKVKDNG